jgi:hypothetical protein
MNVKMEKIVGWLVFFAGLMIIFYSLYSSYNIFTGKTAVPEFFESEEEKTSLPQEKGDIQTQMQEMIAEQLKEFIPANFIPKMLNIGIWTMLAGILIFGGAQISNLGIKLIRS